MMQLTLTEIRLLTGVIDAGVKAAGIQIFQDGGGIVLQEVLNKLQKAANEAGEKDGASRGPNAS